MLPFDTKPALDINKARLDHLASLGLELDNKSVLETAPGVGHLTDFWIKRRCSVLGLELNHENVAENKRRHPDYIVKTCDIIRENWPWSYDIGFCYGTLYHVSDPERLIHKLSLHCNLALIETLVHPTDDGRLHEFGHFAGQDQGDEGKAYVPARDWVLTELRKHFEYAYITATQPANEQFPLNWPSTNGICRAVFVASRNRLDLPTLTTDLPMTQEALC